MKDTTKQWTKEMKKEIKIKKAVVAGVADVAVAAENFRWKSKQAEFMTKSA